MGKDSNNSGDFVHYVIILFTNKFNSFLDFPVSDWSNKMPISLIQISKLYMFMISGFLDLLLMAFLGRLMD